MGWTSKSGGSGDSRVVVPRSDGRIAGGSERTGRTISAKTNGQTGESPIEIKKNNFFVESVTERYILATENLFQALSERE